MYAQILRGQQSSFGRKQWCPSCNARFYDLNRPDPVCPRCGAPAVDTAPPIENPVSTAGPGERELEDARRSRMLAGLSAQEVKKCNRGHLRGFSSVLDDVST